MTKNRTFGLRIAARVLVAAVAMIASCWILGPQVRGADASASLPTAEPAAESVDEPAPDADINIFRLIVDGGYLMIPIGLASAVMVAFAIERLLALRRSKIIHPEFVRKMRELLGRRPFPSGEALAECEKNWMPMARIFRAGIRKLGSPTAEIEKAIEDAGAREVSDMRRNLRAIRVVAEVSPLMGLLGTVWGMIQAYAVAAEGGLGQAKLMAGGIKKALVTTAGGLVVAIPALIIYFYFVGRIDRYVMEMDELSIDLVEGMSAEGDD